MLCHRLVIASQMLLVTAQCTQDTVNPVHKDNSREHTVVVSVDRWSLQRRVVVSMRWPTGQPTMASIDR